MHEVDDNDKIRAPEQEETEILVSHASGGGPPSGDVPGWGTGIKALT